MAADAIDYDKLGTERFRNFCRTIKQLVRTDSVHVDLIVAAGNTGQSMARFTTLIYEALGLDLPPILEAPFYRYYPGHQENPSWAFSGAVLKPHIIEQVRKLQGPIRNVLFVDDEIGSGTTAIGMLGILNDAIHELGLPKIEQYYIVAEDQGFRPPKALPEIVFKPYDHEIEGLNNVIFFVNPYELEKPIADALGDDKHFLFHLRTNILLGLPIKDFNNGSPIFTDVFLREAQAKIPNLAGLQEAYLVFLRERIRTALSE
jgi:hypothetical protein